MITPPTPKERDEERWKPVVDYEGFYEVSDRGRVRNVGCGYRYRWGHILSPRNAKGYQRVYLSKGGKSYNRYVHCLVGAAFMGPCPKGLETNHINGNKEDNRLENLERVTHSQNTQHSFRALGRKPADKAGEKNGQAKLTEKAVVAIKALLFHGWTQRRIAVAYSVSGATISRIKTGKIWKHVW